MLQACAAGSFGCSLWGFKVQGLEGKVLGILNSMQPSTPKSSSSRWLLGSERKREVRTLRA